MKIAVYGSAVEGAPQEIKQMSREIGREIARRGHILITGACIGYPQDAVLGAKEFNGKTIGYSAATDLESHIVKHRFPFEGYSEMIFLPKTYEYKDNLEICHKARNVNSVAACDACIIIGGRSGTLNEFTIAYDAGKAIGILEGSSGITKFINALVEDFNKPSGAIILSDKDPVKLVQRVVEAKNAKTTKSS